MNNLWKRYPEIKRIFGEKWLNDPENLAHPLFQIIHETQYLTDLNNYLKDVRVSKITKDLKNCKQFFDVSYELEIAFFLRKLGLNPELQKKICGIDTDIFLPQEKLVIEVKHLKPHKSIKEKSLRFEPKAKLHPIPEGVKILSNSLFLRFVSL